MSNTRLTTQHRKHPAGANSIGSQGVAHKSTGGILNSFPQPVDPVGNASHRLTNHTVALPLFYGRELGRGCLNANALWQSRPGKARSRLLQASSAIRRQSGFPEDAR